MPPPRRRLTKAERKKQILAQAKELLVTLGFHNTTTKKIAEAAGISEPVLYQHFKTKNALFMAVLREVREATVERWESELPNLPDPLARLQGIMDGYLGSTREHAVELRIIHRALLEYDDPEARLLLRSFYLDTETLLARIIAEGQQTGVFRRNLDPRIGAWELIRSGLAYTLTLPLDIPLYAEPDHVPQAIDCLLHCLLKTDV
jgi:AcrR family transcriptional regulator